MDCFKSVIKIHCVLLSGYSIICILFSILVYKKNCEFSTMNLVLKFAELCLFFVSEQGQGRFA